MLVATVDQFIILITTQTIMSLTQEKKKKDEKSTVVNHNGTIAIYMVADQLLSGDVCQNFLLLCF